jgi:hypothetical protein
MNSNFDMRQYKKIFYIIYFVFIGLTIVFAFFQEFLVNNLGFSFNQIIFTLLPIWAVVGILLMLAEWSLENVHIRRLKNRIRELEKSNTSLKAKLFDQEEELKSGSARTGKIPIERQYKKDPNKDME